MESLQHLDTRLPKSRGTRRRFTCVLRSGTEPPSRPHGPDLRRKQIVAECGRMIAVVGRHAQPESPSRNLRRRLGSMKSLAVRVAVALTSTPTHRRNVCRSGTSDGSATGRVTDMQARRLLIRTGGRSACEHSHGRTTARSPRRERHRRPRAAGGPTCDRTSSLLLPEAAASPAPPSRPRRPPRRD